MYGTGTGVRKDTSKAIELYKVAAAGGAELAAKNLASIQNWHGGGRGGNGGGGYVDSGIAPTVSNGESFCPGGMVAEQGHCIKVGDNDHQYNTSGEMINDSSREEEPAYEPTYEPTE
jgi:hypothetical protein